MEGIDISHGIWDISFGQIVFKFIEPIPGVSDVMLIYLLYFIHFI